MAYAKLQELKKKLKKKITTIAVFSLLVTTAMTGQATTALAATQSLPNQQATIETVDDGEEYTEEAEKVSGPQYKVGQIITIPGSTKNFAIKEVYSTDNDPVSCSFDDEFIRATSGGGVQYLKGQECHLMYTFYKVETPNSIYARFLYKDIDDTVQEGYAFKDAVLTQTEIAEQQAAEKEKEDAEAVESVQGKINIIQELKDDNSNYQSVYCSTNKQNIVNAQTAYDALEDSLREKVDTTKLYNGESDYRDAGVYNVKVYTNTMKEDPREFRVANARSAYNLLIGEYPDLAEQLIDELTSIEKCEADIAAEKAAQQQAQQQAQQEKEETAKKQEELDNLKEFGNTSEKKDISEESKKEDTITPAELLKQHPYPKTFFDIGGYWNKTDGRGFYHLGNNKVTYINDLTGKVQVSNYDKDWENCFKITNINLFSKYTTPALSSIGGSTAFTLHAGQAFKYTGNNSGDYMQITSEGKTGWIKKSNDTITVETRGYVRYVTKKTVHRLNSHGWVTLLPGEDIHDSYTTNGYYVGTKNTTAKQPSTMYVLKSGTITTKAGAGNKVCKINKGSKVSIKNENDSYYQVSVKKGSRSYKGWIKKTSISSTKTYKNKKSYKTLYLAVNTGCGYGTALGKHYTQGTKVNVVDKRYRTQNSEGEWVYTKSYAKAVKRDKSGKYFGGTDACIQYPDGTVKWEDITQFRTKKSQAMNSTYVTDSECIKGWNYINAVRKKNGLKPMEWNEEAYQALKKVAIGFGTNYTAGDTFHTNEWAPKTKGGYNLYIGNLVNPKQLHEKNSAVLKYRELASGNTLGGCDNYLKNMLATNDAGTKAAVEMIGGHNIYGNNYADYAWSKNHHSEQLMRNDFDNGCMVVFQTCDGRFGALFIVGQKD